jgi:CRISPR-associated protein Csx14
MAFQSVVATLGGQPQIVTLALDRLLLSHPTIHEIQVVHLDPSTSPRHGVALELLHDAFAHGAYCGQPLRATFRTPQVAENPLVEILDADHADAIFHTFLDLFRDLKERAATIHLVPTGGRRVLGMLALSAAQMCFSRTDRIWHLFSSEAVRAASAGGAQLHLPLDAEVRLVRIPLTPISELLPYADRQLLPPPHDPAQYDRCRQLWRALSPRQRDVVRATVETDLVTQQAISAQLAITPATLQSHNTTIFGLCRAIWGVPPETPVNMHWLRQQLSGIDLHLL